MRDHQRSPRGIRHWGIPAVLLALFVAFAGVVPALAAGAVQDDGNMFSANARSSAETKSGQIQRDTGKSVTVKTVANLGGKDISATADQFFQQQKLNGVLIYAAKDEKKLAVKVGTDTRQAISTGEEGAIRDQMTQRFAANDFDGGLLNAIDRIGTDLRAAAPARTGNQPATAPAAKKSGSGFPAILVVLLILAVVGVGIFLLMRRNRGSGTPSGPVGGYGGNVGPQGGYGPGYGPGYGQPGGGGPGIGGSIIGGAAAGIGGAIVGNAIYDHFRDRDNDNRAADEGDRASAGDYGAFGDDQGAVSDSGQDVGGWGDGGDSSVGDWGGGGDTGGGGDPGSE